MSVVLVSGGSRGLGAAIVAHLLDAGHHVATFSRRSSAQLATLAEGATDRLHTGEGDLADPAFAPTFVRDVVKRFGRLDALVNNAGLAHDGVLATQSLDAVRQMLDVNVMGSLMLTRAAVRPMLRQRSGRIVQISSIVGLRGYRGLSSYSATKAALDGMTRSLARELGGAGITVNSIAPGFLETEMTHGLDDTQRTQIARRTPVGRLGTPEDVLAPLDFLLSERAGFVTGQVLVVDGGITS